MLDDPLIIALDLENAREAWSLVDRLDGHVSFFKVGMELYAAAGMEFVRELKARGKRVFLDLKFFDIGETVKRATAQVVKSGADFLTVHGNSSMLRAADDGRGGAPLRILAVTVLTSFDESDVRDMGHDCPVSALVRLRVEKALAARMDGVVASPLEAQSIRRLAGPDLLIVTPGVRSAGSALGGQKRVASPAEALRDGANYLVIGRQVTRAADPVSALDGIREEIGLLTAAR